MVFCREGQPERAPLSLILPQLYLGAETDVTQDCLSARGISYVLSVSRCCPQPSFLPQSQYLRIPIDDSLRDDLLPWIPQALRFIDGAMSLGCSVIVHCAAGISRSPALAVAYVMYSLGMDLDHAYRFVKERRPTISPNFNFLGQLQLFQGTLPLKSSHANHPTQQPVSSSDTTLQSASKTVNSTSTQGLLSNHDMQDNVLDNNRNNVIKEDTKADVHCESENTRKEAILTRNPKPEFTLSLSDKLKTLTLSIEPADVQRSASTQQDAHSPTPPKPTHLQLPSLLEKRKSLTLSLTPVCSNPWADHKEAPAVSSSCTQNEVCSTPVGHKGAPKTLGKARRRDFSLNGANRSNSSSRRREKSEKRSCSAVNRAKKEEQPKPNPTQPRRKSDCKTLPKESSTAALQQEAPGCAVEAVEVTDADQSPMSPINLTINRLLGWGERMLLGVLLGPHIKVGQAALPYRC
ncbi:probable dual specificity protein phosphatase DDB_G0281963 [Colossoma macropomum]|uniref:probable dual specificity protein phosphatase DDB_G0281963 n=1 Tax=Colossoma macropomum TaxID=42526 RepID=UPI0018652385|nr:probable dual specificity protein phosphatase DDB_G0281963 [Colossoma macropomum]